MHVHLIGVCGTGMGAFAGLLRAAGHRVTGSDTRFDPPIGPALERWGVETLEGWDPANLRPSPDRVIVGNVCRQDNPEARAAIDAGVPISTFPHALAEFFLEDRRSFVVAGTHGKTTTTSLLAHLLHQGGADPGLLVGGIPRNFGAGFRLGAAHSPFVIEGDEYDSAFFEKTPKFWHYRPWAVALTSIEHDHIDIYPDERSYLDAFVGLIRRLPPDGLLVAFAGDPRVRELAQEARCPVRFYALGSDECGGIEPIWSAEPLPTASDGQAFELFGAGSYCGRVSSSLFGAHNMRNALAALALASEGAGVALDSLRDSVSTFEGIARRQELLFEVGGVRVIDDFAHHPTAVRETLSGLRTQHPGGRLIAAYQPKSATASRKLHQDRYPDAFAFADRIHLAPVGRKEIDASERLDVEAIAEALRARGHEASAPGSVEALVAQIAAEAEPGDTVVLMSNGDFEGAHQRLLIQLTERQLEGRLLAEIEARGSADGADREDRSR